VNSIEARQSPKIFTDSEETVSFRAYGPHNLVKRRKHVNDSKAKAHRLSASVLRTVTAEAVWAAREELLLNRDYSPFDDSDKFDVLLENGERLPPKALFGRALSKVVDFPVRPGHFTGGTSSTCFSILAQYEYQIVPKGNTVTLPPPPPEDKSWLEGNKRQQWHLASERRSGLAAAKRRHFLTKHGKLYCEQCGLDPVKAYGTPDGEACIEVHHARVSVSDMSPGHVTRLEDLQCLCANCHRVAHRRMKPTK